MSTFADTTSLRCLDDAFVEELVTDGLGLDNLFRITYELESAELRELTWGGVSRRQFQLPVFQTLKTRGSEEHQTASPERVTLMREEPRRGRLAWVDVYLEIRLSTRIHDRGTPLEAVSTRDLFTELGRPENLEDLRSELASRYGESVVEKALETLDIRRIEDFRDRHGLFMQLTAAAPKPYDPEDPANEGVFPVCLCLELQPELLLQETMRSAKMCRSLLEHERNYHQVFGEASVKRPYAFVALFPESAASDTTLPGLTAADLRTRTRDLFAAEEMIAHFLADGS